MESEQENQSEEEKESKSKPSITINIQSWATPIIGLVMLAAGLLIGYFGTSFVPALNRPITTQVPAEGVSSQAPSGEQNAPQMTDEQRQELMKFVVDQTRHFKGDPDAPVTMVEFSDFKCPYCGRFASSTGRQIEEEYVKNGDVRFGYIHLPFLSPESQLTAEASECAADQDAFWDYHDAIFERLISEQGVALNNETLEEMADDLELDAETFKECLESGKHRETVETQKSVAQSLGISSTPVFVINGTPIMGAQPFENFKQVIDQNLQ